MRRTAASAVPGTIIALGELASMICRSSSVSITSFSINRSASATSALRRVCRMCADLLQRLVDDPGDLLVDFPAGLLAVAPLAGEIVAAGQKRRAAALAEVHLAQPAHAEVHHHAAGDLGGPFQVVLAPVETSPKMISSATVPANNTWMRLSSSLCVIR